MGTEEQDRVPNMPVYSPPCSCTASTNSLDLELVISNATKQSQSAPAALLPAERAAATSKQHPGQPSNLSSPGGQNTISRPAASQLHTKTTKSLTSFAP